jgi:hypothetical protein
MQSGPGAARNAGFDVCEADIVIFVDADVEVAPTSLARMLGFLKCHPEYAAVFGSYDDSPGGLSTVSKYRDLIFHYRHQTGKTEADTFWSGFGAVRRKPFLSVGGFASGRQDGIEDIEFGARLRAAHHRIALRRDLFCKHHKHWTLRTMIAIDLYKRALPWSRLLLERKCWTGDLNLRPDRRLGVVFAGAAPIGVAASVLEPVFILFAFSSWAGALLVDWKFFRFLWSKSHSLALAAVPLHLVHLSAAAAGFALASLEHAARRISVKLPIAGLCLSRRSGGNRESEAPSDPLAADKAMHPGGADDTNQEALGPRGGTKLASLTEDFDKRLSSAAASSTAT